MEVGSHLESSDPADSKRRYRLSHGRLQALVGSATSCLLEQKGASHSEHQERHDLFHVIHRRRKDDTFTFFSTAVLPLSMQSGLLMSPLSDICISPTAGLSSIIQSFESIFEIFDACSPFQEEKTHPLGRYSALHHRY